MKNQSLWVFAVLFLLASTRSYAAFVRGNGTIKFTTNATFYQNKPDTIAQVLLDPKAFLVSKKGLMERMVKDVNLPTEQLEVLFRQDLNESPELNALILDAIEEFLPG